MNDEISLLKVPDRFTHESTIKLEIADKSKSQLLTDSTTKLTRTGSTWGRESGALNT